MKFRKKPVVVDAEQFFERADLVLPGGVCVCFSVPHDGGAQGRPHIHTLEGVMIVSDGDWIIRGVAEEYYPCKPDIFEKTYERVE